MSGVERVLNLNSKTVIGTTGSGLANRERILETENFKEAQLPLKLKFSNHLDFGTSNSESCATTDVAGSRTRVNLDEDDSSDSKETSARKIRSESFLTKLGQYLVSSSNSESSHNDLNYTKLRLVQNLIENQMWLNEVRRGVERKFKGLSKFDADSD